MDAGRVVGLGPGELARLRQDYAAAGLDEPMLPADPMQLFHLWLHDAHAAGLAEVNAMVVSTVGADGVPSSRMVLCKEADARGFAFFTNYHSRKARELDANPRTSLLFGWPSLGRQVRVEGRAAPVPAEESDVYFATRPRGAQLSAWASEQSAEVADRATLERRVAELGKRYAGDVPRPPHWGGIRVVPMTIEFWQGRADRLHDRLVYRRDDPAAQWSTVRLQP
ncbi:MAG TPA: pyridoxamine 5'-phosphate oxidase [Mycobacteriales bacterium]|nr:pyridoxamine 5'-phosphate oxidase [Mycobacteriales bacterium]